jgi:hypothetical protein
VPTPVPVENILLDRRFQLGKVLGRGPSGVVYAATDRTTETSCVVKRLHPHYYDKDVLAHVERDARAAADVGHPNILAVQHAGYESNGSLFLVMPMIQGESLAQRLQRGALSLSETLPIIEALCAGLQAALDAGLCHGAVTPTNIMLPAAGGLLITDFGMCNLRATPKVLWGGAMGYAAPETFGEGADLSTSRGDVFSVGATVFECLTAQRMFSATSVPTFLASVKSPPSLGAVLPALEQLDAVLEMAATLQPEDRFSTAGALWRALQSSLQDLPNADTAARDGAGKSPRKPPAAPPPPPPRANPPRAPIERALRPVQQLPILPMPDPLPGLVAPAAPAPIGAAGQTASTRLPDPLPPPPSPGGRAPQGAAAASTRRALPSDPQRIIATDPGLPLRRRRRPEFLQPLLWASLGGLVVGATFLGVQYLHGSRITPAPNQSTLSGPDFDESSLMGRAERDFSQRNYASALSSAELVLRTQPQNTQARAILEKASELLRASAIYGAFLRAADREDAEAAGSLYRELPVGSPFRSQAWEPFMHVRNLFIQRRLALAQAALVGGVCEEINEQLDRLHWIADSEADPALQQVQRLLGRCKSSVATSAPPSSEGKGEAKGEAKSERTAERSSKGASAAGLRDPFKGAAGAEEDPNGEKPRHRRRHAAKPSEPGAEAKTEGKPEPAKPDPDAPKPGELPKALRNPF